jgi:DNA-binding phage protein
MAELFRKDPVFATQSDLLIALRQMALAFGGVKGIAAKARLNVTQLYRTLSADGNPELHTLMAVLKAMHMRLAIAMLPEVDHGKVKHYKRQGRA